MHESIDILLTGHPAPPAEQVEHTEELNYLCMHESIDILLTGHASPPTEQVEHTEERRGHVHHDYEAEDSI